MNNVNDCITETYSEEILLAEEKYILISNYNYKVKCNTNAISKV